MIFIILINIRTYSIDTLAVVTMNNFSLPAKDSLEFDLYLTKNSERWIAFANATIQLEFADTLLKIDSTDFSFAYILNTPELPLFTTAGNQLPVEEYLIEPKIFKNRFSITIVGPEKYENCKQLKKGEQIKLGRYTIKSLSGKELPLELKFKEPKEWYQAIAYKRNTDSLIATNTPFYYGDDNVNMDDGINLTFLMNVDKNPDEQFEFKNFWVHYTGQLVDSLGWSISLEKDVNGYFVMRGVRTRIFEVEYTDLVGTWVAGDPKFNPGYISRGYSNKLQIYDPFFDTVTYRGGDYCYSLWANLRRKDGTTYDSILAQQCVSIPNAVISKANPLGNPFAYRTRINLHLDDDCYVDGFVVDEEGKFVSDLYYDNNGKKEVMKRLFMKKSKLEKELEPGEVADTDDERGGYHIDFEASSIASQGLYNAIFIAYPKNDNNIEISKAVVKLQLIKDGTK